MIDGIYAIVDVTAARPPAEASRRARALLAGGVRTLQLRAKALATRPFLQLARELRAMTADLGAAFIVNDWADLAVLAEADAVHLGQDDLPVEAVRAFLPARMKIGVSCHDPEQLAAAAGAADYVGYGPIFPTASKANPDPVVGLDALRAARSAHPALAIVAIGGIDLTRLAHVRRTGVAAAAMISAMTDAGAARRAISIWEAG